MPQIIHEGRATWARAGRRDASWRVPAVRPTARLSPGHGPLAGEGSPHEDQGTLEKLNEEPNAKLDAKLNEEPNAKLDAKLSKELNAITGAREGRDRRRATCETTPGVDSQGRRPGPTNEC
jgi:hypothetical protein